VGGGGWGGEGEGGVERVGGWRWWVVEGDGGGSTSAPKCKRHVLIGHPSFSAAIRRRNAER